MLDNLPISGWQLTGWGLISVAVVLLLRWCMQILKALLAGDLVTRREVDTWRNAWEVSQAANREKDEALAELVQLARTSARVLEHLQDAASKRSEGTS